MPKVSFYTTDDWMCVFVDGREVFSGHSLMATVDIISLLQEVGCAPTRKHIEDSDEFLEQQAHNFGE